MNINDRWVFFLSLISVNSCQIHVWLVPNSETSLQTMYVHFTCMRRIPPCAGDIDVNIYIIIRHYSAGDFVFIGLTKSDICPD